MKIEEIEKKIKSHTDSISKLQKQLEKEQSLIPLFVSPDLSISKAAENCIGWMCIAEDNEYTVFVDEFDIYAMYHGANIDVVRIFLQDDLTASAFVNSMFNWLNVGERCERGIYKFTPHKDNTYSVTPMKINKDYTLSEV